MVPASAIICFLLLGIEEIGVQIEEPFGILPLGEVERFTFDARTQLYVTTYWPARSVWTWYLLSIAKSCSFVSHQVRIPLLFVTQS